MVNQITRTGTVLAVDGAYVKVRVGCMSACSSCDISDKCRSAEGKTLVVTALLRNGQSLCPGDNVIVRESRGKALASVFMGYGAPLLVLLSVCAIGLACSVKEDIVACVAIVIVIIYLILSVAGVLRFGSKKNSESQQTQTETQTESESESESETEGQMIDIRGMSVEDAQKAVDRLKLDLTVFAFETKESSEEDGTILEQDIKAGETVKSGTQINVVIAGKSDSTSEMIKVPSVVGKTKSSAQSTLESAGFKVTFEYGDFNDSVADVVTSQSPSGKAQAAKGSTITVTLSPGQKPITVPNVVGLSQAQAENALSNAGLRYTYADSQYSDTVPSGSVISQTRPGETVSAGTTITLTLSKGKQVTTTSVNKTVTLDVSGVSVTGGSYVLKGSDGQTYASGTVSSESVTVSGTMNCSSGTITVTWEYTEPVTGDDGTVTGEKPGNKTMTVNVP